MSDKVAKVNHSPGDAADEVLDAVHALMHLYRAQQLHALRDVGPQDLTHQEVKVLGFFAHHPGATQGDLIARSGKDKGQVARLVAALRERGLLDARTDEHDRRVTRLETTAAGRKLQATLRRRGHDVAQSSLAGLSDAERAQLLALLRRIRANLEGGAAGAG